MLGGINPLMARPALSFFVELPGEELQQISINQNVISDLKALDASLRIGLLELNEATADAVIRFSQAGIPVYGWLLLSEEQGYWFNADNSDLARQRYADFKAWTQKYQLPWSGVGLDIEPPMNDVKAYFDNKMKFIGKAYLRLFEGNSLDAPLKAYTGLIQQIINDGYPPEVYILPPILDERVAGTESFQKLTRTLDLPIEREIPMVYTSVESLTPAHIMAYGEKGGLIALGSTGGGVNLENGEPLASLDWDGLAKDLLVAQQIAREIHIFSLEGCIAQGFLPLLRNFDWQDSTSLYSGELQEAENSRNYSRIVFRIMQHPLLMSISLLLILFLGLWLFWRLVKGFFGLFRRKKVPVEETS